MSDNAVSVTYNGKVRMTVTLSTVFTHLHKGVSYDPPFLLRVGHGLECRRKPLLNLTVRHLVGHQRLS